MKSLFDAQKKDFLEKISLTDVSNTYENYNKSPIVYFLKNLNKN